MRGLGLCTVFFILTFHLTSSATPLRHHAAERQADPRVSSTAGVTTPAIAIVDEHPETVTDSAATPLLAALEQGDMHLIRMLLKQGADVRETNRQGYTPLMAASRLKSPQPAIALVMNGADVNATDRYGRTALMFAVEAGNEILVETLLQAGAEIDRTTVPSRPASISHTALRRAIANGNLNIVRILLRADADVNICDEHGVSPLMAAVAMGRADIVEALVLSHAIIDDNSAAMMNTIDR